MDLKKLRASLQAQSAINSQFAINLAKKYRFKSCYGDQVRRERVIREERIRRDKEEKKLLIFEGKQGYDITGQLLVKL